MTTTVDPVYSSPVYSSLGYSSPVYSSPVYSPLGYSERVSPHRSLIYSQIKYVYSEYPALVNTFCCTDSFTINGIDCKCNLYRFQIPPPVIEGNKV